MNLFKDLKKCGEIWSVATLTDMYRQDEGHNVGEIAEALTSASTGAHLISLSGDGVNGNMTNNLLQNTEHTILE